MSPRQQINTPVAPHPLRPLSSLVNSWTLLLPLESLSYYEESPCI
ncbi:hypothetical protein LEMLEM_LOCUS3958 [Lemmus lemmus]